MGYMGHPTLQGLTPGFDRLAAEGAAFTRCYSVNPLCMPARNAIHSSQTRAGAPNCFVHGVGQSVDAENLPL